MQSLPNESIIKKLSRFPFFHNKQNRCRWGSRLTRHVDDILQAKITDTLSGDNIIMGHVLQGRLPSYYIKVVNAQKSSWWELGVV